MASPKSANIVIGVSNHRFSSSTQSTSLVITHVLAIDSSCQFGVSSRSLHACTPARWRTYIFRTRSATSRGRAYRIIRSRTGSLTDLFLASALGSGVNQKSMRDRSSRPGLADQQMWAAGLILKRKAELGTRVQMAGPRRSVARLRRSTRALAFGPLGSSRWDRACPRAAPVLCPTPILAPAQALVPALRPSPSP